jgi:hypothetical protein
MLLRNQERQNAIHLARRIVETKADGDGPSLDERGVDAIRDAQADGPHRLQPLPSAREFVQLGQGPSERADRAQDLFIEIP